MATQTGELEFNPQSSYKAECCGVCLRNPSVPMGRWELEAEHPQKFVGQLTWVKKRKKIREFVFFFKLKFCLFIILKGRIRRSHIIIKFTTAAIKAIPSFHTVYEHLLCAWLRARNSINLVLFVLFHTL